MIDKILNDIKNGKPIIVVDDYDRENEGDIVLSAEHANVDNLIFCMNNAKGLMCLPSVGSLLDRLEIPMMVTNSTCKLGTPFTVSIDAAFGITTGMSVYDRLKTIGIMLDEKSVPTDLARPGHLFPLRARNNLLLDRRGHTEASIELMKMSKIKPVSVIVEIMNNNGTMTRGQDMIEYAKMHNLNIISVEEIYNAVYNKSI